MIIILSSGETRFDYGLAAALKFMGIDVTILTPSNSVKVENKTTILCNERKVDLTTLHIPFLSTKFAFNSKNVHILKEMIANYIKPSKIRAIVAPRDITLFYVGFLLSKVFHAPLLWYYSPTPAYIFKSKVYAKAVNSIRQKLSVYIHGLLGILHDYFRGYICKKIIFRDPKTYSIFRIVHPQKTVLIPSPYASFLRGKSAKIEDEYADISLPDEYILSIVTLSRKGIARFFEEKILQLILGISRRVKEINFVVVGTSKNEVKSRGYDVSRFPNVTFLGFISNDNVYSKVLSKATAIFAPQLLPGQSNRVIEAIYYEKPLITTPIAQEYHIGIRQGCTSLICYSKQCFINAIKSIIRQDHVYTTLKEGLKKLRKSFYNSIVIRNILRKTLV